MVVYIARFLRVYLIGMAVLVIFVGSYTVTVAVLLCRHSALSRSDSICAVRAPRAISDSLGRPVAELCDRRGFRSWHRLARTTRNTRANGQHPRFCGTQNQNQRKKQR